MLSGSDYVTSFEDTGPFIETYAPVLETGDAVGYTATIDFAFLDLKRNYAGIAWTVQDAYTNGDTAWVLFVYFGFKL